MEIKITEDIEPIIGDDFNPKLRIKTRLKGERSGFELNVVQIQPILFLKTFQNKPIGSIKGESVLRKFQTSRGEKIDFEFPIDERKFYHIENKRDGKSLKATLQIDCLCEEIRKETDNYDREEILSTRMDTLSAATDIKIPLDEWHSMLEKLNFPQLSVMEYPLPTIPYNESFKSCIERLKSAHTNYGNEQYDGCLTDCRQAVEGLKKMIDGNTALDELINRNCKKEKSYSPKSKRVRDVFNKTMILLHAGPHDSYHVSKEDARLGLYVTSSIISYYAHQLSNLQ